MARPTRSTRRSLPTRPLLESLESRLLLTTATVTALVATNPTLTAYVVSADRKLLTGTVTFVNTNTSTTLGTAALKLVVSGPVDVFAATLTSEFTFGSRTITATYNGDTSHASSHSSKSLTVPRSALIAFGAGAGSGGIVRVIDLSTGQLKTFNPFPGFTGAVNAAVGLHDGLPLVVTSEGPGGLPLVRIFDFLSGRAALVRPGGSADTPVFAAFPTTFHGGVSVAMGDVNNDGFADIIVGKETGGSEIREFSAADDRNLTLLADFNAFVPAFTGGIRLAVGDVNNDGSADVAAVTASGAAVATVFSGHTSTPLFTKNFGPGYTGGGYVTLGDFGNSGRARIILTYGDHALPVVQAFNASSTTAISTFLAYPASFKNSGGTFVATLDINGDGISDIVTNLGTANRLKFVNGANGTHFTALESFFASFNSAVPFSTIYGFNEVVD